MTDQVEVILYGDEKYTQEVGRVSIEATEYRTLDDVLRAIYNAYLAEENEPKGFNQVNLIEKGVIGFRVIGMPITIKDGNDLHALIFALKVKHNLNR